MTTTTSHCDRCRAALAPDDLRCSICGQATPSPAVDRQEVVVEIIRCSGCGAAVAYDPEHRAPSCSFCDSVMEVETVQDPLEQSEGFLPFTVDEENAREALKRWLGSLGWFRPSDLRSASRLEHLKPLWWVGWVFDAEALLSWNGDSNAGSRRSSWAPHAGQTQTKFDDILVSASRGLTDDEVTAIASGYNLSSVRQAPKGAKDATIERFDVQRSQARKEILNAIQSIAENEVSSKHIPGSRFRNVHVSVLLRQLVTRRFSFPAYVLAYRYKNRLYRVVICGQNDSRVSGSAPISFAKILLVASGIIAVITAIAMAVLGN